jgi:hypothetical protein
MRASTRTAAAGLSAIGALHVVWATGSAWPMRDKRMLTDAVVGTDGDQPPNAATCLAVAALLGTAAALVDGRPRRRPMLSRAGSLCVVTVLATRGALGLAGRTDIVSPGSASERFRRLDRRFYSPLCLSLAALALPATRRARLTPLR